MNSNRRQSWGSFTHLSNSQPHCMHQCQFHSHSHNRGNHQQRAPNITHHLSNNNFKSGQRHSLIPQYHQTSVQNLTQHQNRSAFFHLQPSSGSILSSNLNRNFNKQLSTSPGGVSTVKNKDTNDATSNASLTSKKEFELSNLLRIKSNKLGSSAPNLCSSMVSEIFLFLTIFGKFS